MKETKEIFYSAIQTISNFNEKSFPGSTPLPDEPRKEGWETQV